MYQIKSVEKAHMSMLQSWFDSPAALFAWGGPGLKFDVDANLFAEQIKLAQIPSCGLFDERDNLVGFGQYYQRLGRAHLGRIGIAPQIRGRGIGKMLVNQLIKAATPLNQNGVSLFVLNDNQAAIRCYQSLGFEKTDYPEPLPDLYENMWFMLRQANPLLTTVSQRTVVSSAG